MKHLSKLELLTQTKNLVAQERKITNELIAHLAEIQSRRTYSELGFASMWEFATQYLGLSEGAAQRRISAMRLTCAVPEAKEALKTGKLSLSNAAKIQRFCHNEIKVGRPVDGAGLVAQVEFKSQQECDAILHSISPSAVPTERQRIVSARGDVELRVVLTQEINDKIIRLKGLIGHSMPNVTFAELIELMVDQTIEVIEKRKGFVPKSTAAAKVTEKLQEKVNDQPAAAPIRAQLPSGKRVYLPVSLRQAVWKRSGGRCEYKNAAGKSCTSRHRLEIDHHIPLALNGSNELNNLRILCKNHNLQQAQEKLNC